MLLKNKTNIEYNHEDGPSIAEHFPGLKDPRIEQHKKHELMDVIILSICTVISGAEGWKDIADFGKISRIG